MMEHYREITSKQAIQLFEEITGESRNQTAIQRWARGNKIIARKVAAKMIMVDRASLIAYAEKYKAEKQIGMTDG